MSHEPLSAEDATLLFVSDPEAQLQIGAVCFFEAAPLRDEVGNLRLDAIRAHVDARLDQSPRFRKRLASIPFDAGRPMWLDDDHFHIAHHVMALTLPEPGGEAELRRFVGELLSEPLDSSRPLWDAWFVEGVDDDRVAFVLRVHHVLADGLSLFDAAMLLMDLEPRDDPDVGAPWKPEPSPGNDRLLAEALMARARRQGEIAVGAVRPLASLLDPRRVPGVVRSVADTVAGAMRGGVETAPPMPLNGRVGPHRDVLWAAMSMPDLMSVKRAHGTTLNDVVLTVVTGALRRHLGDEVSAELADLPPRVLVPVGSVGGDDSGAGNSFSALVAELPVATADPLERLAEVHAEMVRRKQGGGSSMVSSLFSVVDVVPPLLLRRLGPLALSRQPFANLAVTNIPGSPLPMYLLGSQLQAVHPFITGVGNIALIIGVLSYGEELGVGLTVDPEVIDDPDGFLAHLEASAAELVAQAAPARRTAEQ